VLPHQQCRVSRPALCESRPKPVENEDLAVISLRAWQTYIITIGLSSPTHLLTKARRNGVGERRSRGNTRAGETRIRSAPLPIISKVRRMLNGSPSISPKPGLTPIREPRSPALYILSTLSDPNVFGVPARTTATRDCLARHALPIVPRQAPLKIHHS
jgi:hypothetical protein